MGSYFANSTDGSINCHCIVTLVYLEEAMTDLTLTDADRKVLTEFMGECWHGELSVVSTLRGFLRRMIRFGGGCEYPDLPDCP